MARGKAETCRLEKVCKNILVIKTLNKLCLTILYLYIFSFDVHGEKNQSYRAVNTRRLGYKNL